MALDAANSIQAANSLEKMLAHQMAAAHKPAMELMGPVCYEQNATDQTKRLNAAAPCMAVYQRGLLAYIRCGKTASNASPCSMSMSATEARR
jgi:hypothetical protein